MKVCPNCKKEYADDLEVCPADGTVLENSEIVSEAETIALPTTDAAQTAGVTSEAAATPEENEKTAETIGTTEAAKPAVVPATTAAVSTTNRGGGSGTLAKALTVLAVILAIGVALVVWKTKVGGQLGHSDAALTKLTKEDMQILLKDANPMALKQLAENPELKQKQVESIKEFLAVASQARKEGLTNDPEVKKELEDIRTQIIAVNYDREKNKDKGQMPPFSLITEDEVKTYYEKPGKQAQFDEFIKTKVEQAKKDGRIPQDREPSAEEINEARDFYGKVHIYEDEAREKSKAFGEEYNRKVELQIKLQQAQYLNKLYAEKVLTEKVKVSDEEVAQYIAAHPEMDPKAKKAKAEEILQRAKSGEDFAKLADELSEDPGTKGKGGLYKDVKKGQMLPEFEQAALALEPGKVADNVVETKFGYHIIKLEKKGTAKDKEGKEEETYDVRHILISTMFSDPKNPFGQPVPISEKIKSDLQEEKSNKILEEIKAKNPIEVEDFEVPKPSDEDIQKMMQMQQQRQMPNLSPEDLEGDESQQKPTKAPKKPEPKKK